MFVGGVTAETTEGLCGLLGRRDLKRDDMVRYPDGRVRGRVAQYRASRLVTRCRARGIVGF